MLVRVTRTGGIAGRTLTAEVDTSGLPGVPEAVAALPRGVAATPNFPDGFQYEITPLDGPDPATAIVGERELTPPLQTLVAALREHGTVG